MKAKQFILLMIALIAGLSLLIFLGSCYSSKKAEKEVSKALAYYPEQTIGKVRILAPCVTSGHSFTTDSAAYKASIDSLYNSRGWYESLIRGLENLPPHPIEQDSLCPEMAKELLQAQKEIDYQEQYIIDITDRLNNLQPVIINRTDTIEDLAKVMEKDLQLLDARKLYKQQTDELTNVKSERDKAVKAKNKLIWWIVGEGIGLLVLLALMYFLLKGKATAKII